MAKLALQVLVQTVLFHKLAFALYRLPQGEPCLIMERPPEGTPAAVASTPATVAAASAPAATAPAGAAAPDAVASEPLGWHNLTNHNGFVMVPFAPSASYPLTMIAADAEAQGWDDIYALLLARVMSQPELLATATTLQSVWEAGAGKAMSDKASAGASVAGNTVADKAMAGKAGAGAAVADKTMSGGAGADSAIAGAGARISAGPLSNYHEDFACFSAALHAASFAKLVLSSYFEQEFKSWWALSSFNRACASGQNLMVVLVNLPVAGSWFVATPEALLRGTKGRYSTMSLAGTRPFNEQEQALSSWSEKDRQEQAYVTSYIREVLERYATDIVESGPKTARAGLVMHLKTDFSFALPQEDQSRAPSQQQLRTSPSGALSPNEDQALSGALSPNEDQALSGGLSPSEEASDGVSGLTSAENSAGGSAAAFADNSATGGNDSLNQLIQALHPTPAVCGLPKQEAFAFIQEHESYQRGYYAGVIGRVKHSEEVQLFVNLRAAQISLSTPTTVQVRSFVGGGLLAASQESSEYAEICAKNRSILANIKPE